MTSCCRLCYSETEIVLPIYDENGTDNKGMAGSISRFLEVELNELTSKICVSCWASVDNFQKFFNMVAEKQLQNLQDEFNDDPDFKVDMIDIDEAYGGMLESDPFSECELEEEEASDTSNVPLKRLRSNDPKPTTSGSKQSPKSASKQARLNVMSVDKLNKQVVLKNTDVTELPADILKVIDGTATTIIKEEPKTFTVNNEDCSNVLYNGKEQITDRVKSNKRSWIDSNVFNHSASVSLLKNIPRVIDILKSSTEGLSLMDVYAEKKIFTDVDRKKLLNVITEHFFVPKEHKYIIPLTHQMQKIAEEIVEVFPTETREIYYISRRESRKPNPNGMLFNRFNNINRKRSKVNEQEIPAPKLRTVMVLPEFKSTTWFPKSIPNVTDILKVSSAGLSLINIYSENKCFSRVDRKKLVNAIAEHFYIPKENKYVIPRPHQLEKMAEEIEEAFPTETKDTYYISRRELQKPNPNGMLFNKFNNLNRKRSKAEKPEKEHRTDPLSMT